MIQLETMLWSKKREVQRLYEHLIFLNRIEKREDKSSIFVRNDMMYAWCTVQISYRSDLIEKILTTLPIDSLTDYDKATSIQGYGVVAAIKVGFYNYEQQEYLCLYVWKVLLLTWITNLLHKKRLWYWEVRHYTLINCIYLSFKKLYHRSKFIYCFILTRGLNFKKWNLQLSMNYEVWVKLNSEIREDINLNIFFIKFYLSVYIKRRYKSCNGQ